LHGASSSGQSTLDAPASHDKMAVGPELSVVALAQCQLQLLEGLPRTIAKSGDRNDNVDKLRRQIKLTDTD